MKSARIILCCLYAAAVSSGTEAAAQSVWNLKAGDRFSVEHVLDQESTVTLDESDPDVVRTQERFVIQYHVQGIRRQQTVIEVRIAAAELKSAEDDNADHAGAAAAEKLKALTFLINLAPDGVVEPIEDYDGILRSLSGVDERTETRLRRLVSESAIRTFVSLPFWAKPPNIAEESSAKNWDRILETPLGPLGAIRHLVTISRDESRTLTLSADSQHVPPGPKSSSLSEDVRFSNVKVTEPGFSGTVTLPDLPAETSENEENQSNFPKVQLPFEDIRFQTTIDGQATLTTGTVERMIAFQQTQKHKCRLLPGSWLQRPRFPFPDVAP